MLKFTVFAALFAVTNAGLLDYGHGYAAPAATSHSSISQHTVSHAAPAAYAAPIAHYSQTPSISYAHSAPAVSYSHSGYGAQAVNYGAPAVSYGAPIAKVAYAAPVAKAVVAEPFTPAHYDFSYSVNDPHTGDIKEQKESRQGDTVHGVYSLVEPDGSRRIVEYTADPHNGFNAVVHREHGSHPVAVKTVAPVVKYAAPAVNYGHHY